MISHKLAVEILNIALSSGADFAEIYHEENGSHCDDRMDLPCLLRTDLRKAVHDEACRDSVGDAICEAHDSNCEECRHSLLEILPVDLCERLDHQDTDNNESWRCRC